MEEAKKPVQPQYIIPCNMDSIGRVLIPAAIRHKLNFNSHTNLTLAIIDGKVVISAIIEEEAI